MRFISLYYRRMLIIILSSTIGDNGKGEAPSGPLDKGVS